MLNINKASRTICNESCQKSQQLQFAEIRKMVSVDPAWNILTCASQNMDEEMSKLLAVTGGPSSEYEELYGFFLLICERSAKRDMGHILLPNYRIGSRET